MDVKLRVIKVLENGKRRFDREDKERLIDACLEPGVSLARLALDHGVNANLLRNWVSLRRRQQEARERPAPTFIPVIEAAPIIGPPVVSVGSLALGRSGASTAPVRPPRARQRSSRMRLRVTMANGVRLELEGGDAPLVSAMIEALGRCDVPPGA